MQLLKAPVIVGQANNNNMKEPCPLGVGKITTSRGGLIMKKTTLSIKASIFAIALCIIATNFPLVAYASEYLYLDISLEGNTHEDIHSIEVALYDNDTRIPVRYDDDVNITAFSSFGGLLSLAPDRKTSDIDRLRIVILSGVATGHSVPLTEFRRYGNRLRLSLNLSAVAGVETPQDLPTFDDDIEIYLRIVLEGGAPEDIRNVEIALYDGDVRIPARYDDDVNITVFTDDRGQALFAPDRTRADVGRLHIVILSGVAAGHSVPAIDFHRGKTFSLILNLSEFISTQVETPTQSPAPSQAPPAQPPAPPVDSPIPLPSEPREGNTRIILSQSVPT